MPDLSQLIVEADAAGERAVKAAIRALQVCSTIKSRSTPASHWHKTRRRLSRRESRRMSMPAAASAVDHVPPVDQPAARSPPASPSRAALAYLSLSGATSISIIMIGGIARLRPGIKPNADIFWLDAAKARKVLKKVRSHAGTAPDRDTLVRSLHEVAREERIGITAHAVPSVARRSRAHSSIST